MQGSQGSKSQTKEIAYDLLIGSKFGISNIAKASTEATNPQLRIFLNEAMTESIQEHFMLADLLVSKGLYQPLNVQQQIQNDVSESQSFMQQSQKNSQQSNNGERNSSSSGYEEFGSEMTGSMSQDSSDSSQTYQSSSKTTGTSWTPQTSSFDQSSSLGDMSSSSKVDQSYTSGQTTPSKYSQTNQTKQEQATSLPCCASSSQGAQSKMEEYSSELQGRQPSTMGQSSATNRSNSNTGSSSSQQNSSSTQQAQKQKQSPTLPYTTALAPHEVLELHELVRTDAICLKKAEVSLTMVQDSDLKSLMQNSSQQKRQFLDDSETFFERSAYKEFH